MQRSGSWLCCLLLIACNQASEGDSARTPLTVASEPGTDVSSAVGDKPHGGDDHGQGGHEGVAPASGLPCEVRSVLNEHCVSCHGATPQFGAPMSLVTWDDLQAPSSSNAMQATYLTVGKRITDSAHPMPPSPHARLSGDDLSALTEWIADGAPRSDEPCEALDPAGPDASGDFPDPSECDVSLELRAGDGNGGFNVPLEEDRYECFYFKSDLTPDTLGLGFRPIVDDSRVLHHWLLYATVDAGLTNGAHESCSGVHPGATLLSGWAPGGENIVMPPDVGMQLPNGKDAFFILEIHYHNSHGLTDTADRSGVELCATKKPKKNLAAVHWLGSENIFLLGGQGTASSTCTPTGTEPVHLLGVSPHMHTHGRHSKMIIKRSDGAEEVFIDEPFEFANQITYRREAVLNPGDTITSTCTFDNDSGAFVTFGEKTADEMCYMFTIAYPVGAMNTGGDFAGVGVPGPNRCMH